MRALAGVEQQKNRSKIYLALAVLLFSLLVLLVRMPSRWMPGIFRLAHSDARYFLSIPLFTLGKVSVSLLFLFKAALYILILSFAVARFRVLIYSRLRTTALGESRAYMLARFTSSTLFAVGIIAGLEMTGLNFNTLAIIGGTLGLGIGFGLQSIVANWMAGLVLLIEQPIRIGDVIALQTVEGVVVRIGGRSTWVKTYDDEIVIIPNSDLTNHKVVNWTANDLKVRLHIPVGVGYASDVDLVRDLFLKIMNDHPLVLKSPPPEVIFQAFGDSSLNFLLRFWAGVSPDHDQYGLKSDLYFSIFKACREHGIELPFPQRDVHLVADSSVPLTKSAAAQ